MSDHLSGRGEIVSKLECLHAFLSSPLVQSLLYLHPNELATEQANIPQEWHRWLDWSSIPQQGWLRLVHYYMTGRQEQISPIPDTLQRLLAEIRGLQLPRHPITLKEAPIPIKETGMSPKKVHEVSRMATYVLDIIRVNGWDPFTLRIVDVGAGQGYLTRALKAHLPHAHILALDADVEQTIGAQRWERKLLPPPSAKIPPISHKTIHVTPEALCSTIDEWTMQADASIQKQSDKIPVLLIGLHACGSLTPDIIRTFYQSDKQERKWKFAGVVVVGCCYNLMNPGDFPLSQLVKGFTPRLDFPTSAYHLATQIPTQWLSELSPPTPTPSVRLALRKVTWRALLGKKLQRVQDQPSPLESRPVIDLAPGRQLPWSRLPPTKSQSPDMSEIGTGATPELRRLGRLRDSAYTDWVTFSDVAGKKMGVNFGSATEGASAGNDTSLERFLEVVHTLRCLLGPVVETAFVLDRMAWIEEGLEEQGHVDMQTSFVNLFDQATGSGRNIAIVIAPLIPPAT